MPKAYSMDLRKWVIEACDQGQTLAKVLAQLTPVKCENDLRNAGYALQIK